MTKIIKGFPYVSLNLYFVYDFLGLDFGKSIEKSIVDTARQPGIASAKKRGQELRDKITNNSQCADEPFDPSRRPLGGYVPTNSSMLQHYIKKIEEDENWTLHPKFRYMAVGFDDYGSFTSSDLAEATCDNKWGGISISGVDRECELRIQNDSVVLHEEWMFTRTVIERLSSVKNICAQKIRLLYM